MPTVSAHQVGPMTTPAPICSPGESSIRAVMSPAPSEALYFVADARGGHVFTQTLREHVAAKKKMKEELKRQREAQKAAGGKPAPPDDEPEGS